MKQYQLFIDGEFVESGSRKVISVVNPATEKIISEVPAATAEDAARAVDAAERAQKSWDKLPAVERGKYLREIAGMIRENAEMLARTIAEEQGKTLPLSRVEVNFTAAYMD